MFFTTRDGRRATRSGLMYKSCKTERSALRQRRIVEVMQTMLYHQPYDTITVSALCERAGVPRKAFYRYFECKLDVVYAIADFSAQEYERQEPYPNAPHGPRTLKQELEKLFLLCRQSKPLLDALRRDNLYSLYFRRIVDVSFANRDNTRNLTFQTDEVVLRTANMFVLGGIVSVMEDWMQRGCPESEREMAATAAALLTHPLARAVSAPR